MDNDRGNNICALCCRRFKVSTNLKAFSDTGYLFQLQKFCDSIGYKGSENGKDVSKRKKKKKSSSSDISTKIVPLILCQDCLPCMSSILEKKRELAKMEVEVRKLQVKIVKLLQSLTLGINGYQEEMEKVEGILANSSVRNLDEFFETIEEEKTSSAAYKDVIQFREKILTVLDDLRVFHKDISWTNTEPSTQPMIVTSRNSKEYPDSAFPSTALIGNSWDSPNDNGQEQDDVTKDCNDPEELEDNEEVSGDESDKQSNFSDEEVQAADSDTTDDDDDYTPTGNIPKNENNSSGSIGSPKKESQLSTIDFTGMTSFQTTVITKVIKKYEFEQRKSKLEERVDRSQGRPPTNKSTPSTSSNPQIGDLKALKSHYFSYEATTKSFSLYGIRATFNDEKDECLDCSKCGQQFKLNNTTVMGMATLFRSLKNHILGSHLDAFSCPHCPSKLLTYQRFRDHVLGHRNQFICDICGRPLKGQTTLQKHKWLHMNEQEKAEALEKKGIQDGMDPFEKEKARRKALEKKYQCSTCGKAFEIRAHLKVHEAVHTVERKFMCPICGKTYKSASHLACHQKYVCYPGKGENGEHRKFQCDQCPQKFAFKVRLRQHKNTAHPERLDGYKCSVCGKAFKSRANLYGHEKTHSDARPFFCEKGCGASYKNRRHSKRHEKTCAFGQVSAYY